jgi:hypothetical protein
MSAHQPAFAPYENEADVVEVGNLMLENRLDRITISGDVDLTADRAGLEASLEKQDLPEHLPAPSVKTVSNPFD